MRHVVPVLLALLVTMGRVPVHAYESGQSMKMVGNALSFGQTLKAPRRSDSGVTDMVVTMGCPWRVKDTVWTCVPSAFVGTELYSGGNLVEVAVVLATVLMMVTMVDVNHIALPAVLTISLPGVAQA